jgi:hypothetical protein
MKEGHHCTRLRGVWRRGSDGPGRNGRRLEGGAAIPRLEVEGAPDRGAPPVSLWRKRERGAQCWAGGGGGLGRCGLPARGEKEACGLGSLRAERERGKGNGPAGKKGERGKEGFFLLNSFQIRFFQTFKLQSSRNPCIRIMMHKHLLFLNYFSDV